MKKNTRLNLRKLLMLLAVAVMLLSCLSACNKDKPSDNPDDGIAIPTDTVQDVPADSDVVTPTVVVVPEETAPEVVMGTVIADNLRVRSNPSTDSSVLNLLAINTRVVIIEQRQVGEYTWGRIQDGWINLDYVLLDGADPVEEPDETEPAKTDDNKTTNTNTDSITGKITASELNIRKSASADSEAVGKYVKGATVEILETKNGWGRTEKGWISLKYVNTSGKIETEDKTENKTEDKDEDEGLKTLVTNGKKNVLGHVVVDIGSLNVRYGPGTKYAKSGTVTRGERLEYYQESGNWVRVKKGWISTSYATKEAPLSEKEASTLVTDSKTDVLGTVTIKVETLNVRYGPSTRYNKVKSVSEGDKFDYYQQKDGWVRIKDGWISMTYTDKKDSANKTETSKTIVSDKSTKILGYVTVSAEALNLRYGPGTKYDVAGEVEKGDKLAYYQKDGNWVRTEKGWLSTKYAKADNAAVTYKAGKGTITASSLKIRETASINAKQVGSYEKGDKIEILEVSGEWGKTDKGWVNLQYVKMD